MQRLEDPALLLGITILGTALILAAIVIDVTVIARAFLAILGIVPTALAFDSRRK